MKCKTTPHTAKLKFPFELTHNSRLQFMDIYVGLAITKTNKTIVKLHYNYNTVHIFFQLLIFSTYIILLS